MSLIPIYEPFLDGNEKKYILECVNDNWISSQGDFILKFEKSLANYHNVDHAIVTSNCTTALHLSLKSLGIGPGDEIICPNLTFISPANMITLSGAKLVLVDIDKETLTIDPNIIEDKITSNTRAILVVHQFGHSAHMDEIKSISKKYDLKIIEDNAESLGGKYKGKLLGTLGDISTNSFFGNKIITTGEGGAILTNNPEVNILCRELRDHGMNHKKKYDHIHLGYNYRMTNMQAAIGLAQVEKLDDILLKRQNQLTFYEKKLSKINEIKLREFKNWCTPVHWLMTITLKRGYNRDALIDFMRKEGVDCRQMVNPVSSAKHFYELFKHETFPVSEDISSRSVHLPSSTSLTNSQIDYIVKKIKIFFSTRS